MFVKQGDVKILNIVDVKEIGVDTKKVRKAVDKQKKAAKAKICSK